MRAKSAAVRKIQTQSLLTSSLQSRVSSWAILDFPQPLTTAGPFTSLGLGHGMAWPQPKHILLGFAPEQNGRPQSLCRLISLLTPLASTQPCYHVPLLSGMPPPLDCKLPPHRIPVLLTLVSLVLSIVSNTEDVLMFDKLKNVVVAEVNSRVLHISCFPSFYFSNGCPEICTGIKNP